MSHDHEVTAQRGVWPRPHSRHVRPLTATLLAVAIAYGAGLWLQLMHVFSGIGDAVATGAGAQPVLTSWLRDASLSLPLVLLSVWAATYFTARFLGRSGQDVSEMTEGAVLAALVALSASVVFAVVYPLLSHVFAPAIQVRGLPALPVQMLSDGMLASTVSFPLALVIAYVLRRQLWQEPRPAQAAPAATTPTAPTGGWVRAVRGRTRDQQKARIALAGALALAAAVSGTNAAVGLNNAHAASGSNPCPANVAVKSFDVTAMDVNIPLNRFGDHDPKGKMFVLNNRIGDVIAQANNPDYKNRVSIGLHGGDAIQPLVIRANEGDCVTINFTNNASGGSYGIHIDGLTFASGSSGDAVGNNASSQVAQGGTASYTYYIPNDPNLEGAHYLHPGASNRAAVNHGLFGTLVVEPPNSAYYDNNTNPASPLVPLASGWEAVIAPGNAPSFRENVIIYHEIGNESEQVLDVNNSPLPINDPFTHSYRPGSRALNYRSEPFMDRLALNDEQKSVVYGSYAFGDPATPMPRGYQADPTKQRILHAGSEVFHIHHLHGGGIRWRFNPKADPTFHYFDTGLNKAPKAQMSESLRLDSQAIGPGESYNLEIEGGAGGVQQGAGEFLFHCHIAEHYFSGMWSFWRVYDTLQPDLAKLPDRVALPQAVNSAGLIGKTFNGVTLTAQNLAQWVEPQLPPAGVKFRDPKTGFSQDASVMDWVIDTSTGQPVYLGEKEDTSNWPDLPRIIQGHPGSLAVDQFLTSDSTRPEILFDPVNGRPAFPLLRPHIGDRPPFSPNGHSGAPWLGELGDQASTTPAGVPDPWANRADGICPSTTANGVDGAQIRHNNIIGLPLPIQNTANGVTDPNGALFVLAQNHDAVLNHTLPSEPLALRANIGDCLFNTLVSEEHDGGNELPFAKVNIHIHHVQFDTQASDGVISGFSYDQSVRPYQIEDTQLTQDANAGDTVLHVADASRFHSDVYFAVGEGTNDIEINQLAATDTSVNTVTLKHPLKKAHASGQWAGVEFVQYIWYPDVELDNIFFHDHVNGIFGWSHGMVGQLIVEPKGSTYHDPKTGAVIASGALADIWTSNPLAPGVPGSFRELALWTIDNHSTVGSSINLRAEPWADRGGDPSLLFSSYTHGDPFTIMPRAYKGDPIVIRTINVGQGMQTLTVDGLRTFSEPRFTGQLDPTGQSEVGNTNISSPTNTIHYGISEKFTLVLNPTQSGDYLYHDGVERSFKGGAWGIIRVLPGQSSDLEALPGNAPGGSYTQPAVTGGPPPAASGPDNPCAAGAPVHSFNVTAIDVPSSGWGGGSDGRKAAYVLSSQAASILKNKTPIEPLVLHVAAGECVKITLTNQRNGQRASIDLGGLMRTLNSSGINVGFNAEQTVAPGQSRTYTFYADSAKVQSAPFRDYGGNDSARDGLYGAVIVAPAGATFTDPASGASKDVGSQVIVHVPANGSTPATSYRDFSLILADQDPIIGQSAMPYPSVIQGPALVNYMTADPNNRRKLTDPNFFNSSVYGDPATPMLKAYAGDAVVVHVLNAPGSEQLHTFSLGGMVWPVDPNMPGAEKLATRGVGPDEKFDAVIDGGVSKMPGDYVYQDRRLAFTEGGMWGLIRVLPNSGSGCPIKPLDGSSC
jgi:FtsP/CotA-like multicopper oxidase with cupredoxin domain